jgi:hypothetical protein
MEVVKLSIPCSSLALRENERIGGFEVDVSGGQVTSFPNAPAGWQICIHNDPNQTARIGGNAFVGSAFLEASFFNDFVSVKTDGQPESPTIKVKIAVMNGITLEQRSIDLEMKDLALKKAGEGY